MKLFNLFLIFSLAITACVRADLYTASRACVRVSCSSGVGSGIVVGSDGKFYYALTNAHVATQATARVEFFDAGRVTETTAQIVQRDADVDLAVLKIDTKGYNPAIVPIDPACSIKEGDVLCTIGHPQGRYPTAFFCTYRKTDPIFGVMFTPPPIEGRSGSPLLSKDGERVIGIVYGYTTAERIGLAIPAKYVADFVQGAVTGTKSKNPTWTPPKDSSVFRFTQKHSILEAETIPETEGNEAEIVETRREFQWFTGRRWFFWNRQKEKTGPKRRIFPFKQKSEEGKPELTGIRIQVGDVDVEAGSVEEAAPVIIPPIYPVPFIGPMPPPPPPVQPTPPRRTPNPPKPPKPPQIGDLVEKGTVKLTQYPYVPQGNCPNGNCPNVPSVPATPPKIEKPSNIKSTEPIPAEIITPETELIPKAEPEPQPKPEPKQEAKPEEKPKRDSDDKIVERIVALEKTQAETVKRVESAENEIETQKTLFGKRPIGDALENGLGNAGENLGKALTLEVGADVKSTLAQTGETLKSGTEALKTAEKSFTETMKITRQTLAEIQECTANVTRVLWILTFGLLSLAFLWVCSNIGKLKYGTN